jgi:hypothetical protein
MYEPTDKPMEPIEGFRLYGEALRGDWGSIDGRSERRGIDNYVEWALTMDADLTTEKDILPMVERYLDTYVVEHATIDGVPSRRAAWSIHVEEEIEAREVVRVERELQALDDAS